MRHLRVAVLLPAFVLSACSGLLHSTAPQLQLYVLQSPATAAAPAGSAPGPVGPTLRIARPLTAAGLNTDRIAVLRPDSRLDYYAGSRWSAPLPEVVSDLELTVLRTDPAWGAVADDRAILNADYLLETSIDRFTAVYSDAAPPVVHVDLHCLLLRRSDGALLGSFAISRSQAAAQNHMTSVVEAFGAAADQAVTAAAGEADQLLRSAKSPAAP